MIFLVLLGLVVLLILTLKLLGLAGSRIVEGAVVGNLRAADAILQQQRIPEEWIPRIIKRSRPPVGRRTFGPAPEDGHAGSVDPERAKAALMQRLQGLEAFFRKANCFEDRASRVLFFRQLRRVRVFWEKSSWESLTRGWMEEDVSPADTPAKSTIDRLQAEKGPPGGVEDSHAAEDETN